jgi:predicted nucleotidyltransferase
MDKNSEIKGLHIRNIEETLSRDPRVIFAYLYGSFTDQGDSRDVDIAVYAKPGSSPLLLSAELKIALSESTGLAPDLFDIKIINGLLEHGDLFSLLFLKRLFESHKVLADKDYDLRTGFLEGYNIKYRECEGLFDEILT